MRSLDLSGFGDQDTPIVESDVGYPQTDSNCCPIAGFKMTAFKHLLCTEKSGLKADVWEALPWANALPAPSHSSPAGDALSEAAFSNAAQLPGAQNSECHRAPKQRVKTTEASLTTDSCASRATGRHVARLCPQHRQPFDTKYAKKHRALSCLREGRLRNLEQRI